MFVVWTIHWIYISVLYCGYLAEELHCQERPLRSCDLETLLTSGNCLTDVESDIIGRAQIITPDQEWCCWCWHTHGACVGQAC